MSLPAGRSPSLLHPAAQAAAVVYTDVRESTRTYLGVFSIFGTCDDQKTLGYRLVIRHRPPYYCRRGRLELN